VASGNPFRIIVVIVLVFVPSASGWHSMSEPTVLPTLRHGTPPTALVLTSAQLVARRRTAEPQRASISDAAGGERFVRLTRHPDVGRFTLTHRGGRRCVASIQVSPDDADDLLAVLAEGLAEARPTWLATDV
jgi:hypothetical protein